MSRTVLAAFLAASWAAASVSAQDMGTTPPPAPEPSPSASASASSSSSASSNKASEPFYRKYLVPGNRLDEQILEQEKRIAETPSDASLHNDFGNLLAKRRFPKEAAEQYEIAAKLDKSNFIAYYNLGLLHETEGKIGAAISAYERSIKRKPGFPPSRFRLGRLYEREGKPEDAISQYSQAFLTDPSMRDPRRNPLVIDSELIYRASLQNYQRDVATAVESDAMWVEENRFKTVPVDRAVASEEVEPAEPGGGAPKEVGPAGAGAAGAAEGAHPRRPRPPVAGEGGGMVGGPQQRTSPVPRPGRMNRPGLRPTPAPAPPAPEMAPPPEEAPPAQPEPGQDPNAPETMPEQPQPPPDEVEPSRIL